MEKISHKKGKTTDRQGYYRADGCAGYQREITLLILAGFLIFLAASLLSWDPNDPCLTSFSFSGSHNWMGPIGAHVAGMLMDLFGYGSWALLLAVIMVIWRAFKEKDSRIQGPLPFFSGLSLMFVAVLIILGLNGREVSVEPASYPDHSDAPLVEEVCLVQPGGGVGAWLAWVLTRWFGWPGTVLLALTSFLSGLILSTPFTLSGFIHWSMKTARWLMGKDDLQAGKGDLQQPPSLVKDPRGNTPGKKRAAVKDDKGDSGESIEMPRIKKMEELQREAAAKKTATGESLAEQKELEFKAAPMTGIGTDYELPSLDYLQEPPEKEIYQDQEVYYENARTLEAKLRDFGVRGKVVEISPGPVVTMYEFEPAPGVKINKVASLVDDLALALKTRSVRIVAPIPGKAVIGIELANPKRQIVYLKEVVGSDLFMNGRGKLLIALGQDIVGNPVVTDLARMPHLLIAGATGTGKSVGLNAIICSLIYRMGPDTLRLLMIDPKRIELSLYDGIPHLIHPVVSDPKGATRALKWAVMEMERRYQLLEDAHCRNLENYNKNTDEPLPYLVVIIDELADLMMVSSKDVEAAIARLAQMARAAGIHLLIATQRPSVDVLTGLIKANFPARISFKVSTKVDSRTILDTMGAERLLGMGDMLFLPPGTASLERIHGAYVAESEILKVVEHWKQQQEPSYDLSVLEAAQDEEGAAPDSGDAGGEAVDTMYDKAVEIVTQTGQASISGLQRRLRVGYNRAARMIEQMERDGIVTPTDSMGRRQVIARGYDDV